MVEFIQVRWVHLASPLGMGLSVSSLGEFWHVLGVVGFIQVRRVDLASPLVLSGPFGFVGLIRARPGGHLGSLGLFGRALGVVVFIRARPECRLGSFLSALAVVGFLRALPRFVGFIQLRWGAPWMVVGFIQARPAFRWVRSVSLGPYGRTLWVVGFICVRWVHLGAALDRRVNYDSRPGGHRVELGSLGSFGCAVGFCWVHSGSPRVSLVTFRRTPFESSWSFVFILARPESRRVHSGSLVLFWNIEGVVGFLWVHLASPLWSLGSFGFVPACPSVGSATPKINVKQSGRLVVVLIVLNGSNTLALTNPRDRCTFSGN